MSAHALIVSSIRAVLLPLTRHIQSSISRSIRKLRPTGFVYITYTTKTGSQPIFQICLIQFFITKRINHDNLKEGKLNLHLFHSFVLDTKKEFSCWQMKMNVFFLLCFVSFYDLFIYNLIFAAKTIIIGTNFIKKKIKNYFW